MERLDLDVEKQRQEAMPDYRDKSQTLEEYAMRMRCGEKIGIAELLESIMSGLMKMERDIFLKQVQTG